MLLIRKKPDRGALFASLLALAADTWLLIRTPHPTGQRLAIIILIALACIAGIAVFAAIRKKKISGVTGTSLAGAIMHNVGQILAASFMLRTPQLLYTYLPVLVGIGAVVGCLTGIVAQRVFKSLRVGNIQ